MANPLLREPLRAEHVKPRLLGHFGTVPGLNLVYVARQPADQGPRPRRGLRRRPGHGGPGPNACAWLEGTYSELYSHIPQDERGHAAFFRQFSFPGGVPSHCAPETPGSFHEGGELGYSLLHAYGAALDNPDLTVFCVVGDGEAETGPLADQLARGQVPQPGPRRRGAADPRPQRVQDRQPDDAGPHPRGRAARADARLRLRPARRRRRRPGDGAPGDRRGARDLPRRDRGDPAQARGADRRVRATPAPAVADDRAAHAEGLDVPADRRRPAVEGTFRAHQVPLPRARTDDEHRAVLEQWLRAYRPEELFDDDGRPVPELLALPADRRPTDERQPGRQRRQLLRDLRAARLARLRRRRAGARASQSHEATRVLGAWLRDVTQHNPTNFLTVRARTSSPATGCRTSSRSPAGTGRSEVGEYDERLDPRRPGHRGAVRAHLPGPARGLPAHRPARRVHLLRGVHPHRRLDVQPARQVAGGQRAGAVAAPDREPQLPAVVARVAPGPQRLHPPGPRLPRRRAEQEARRSCGSTCRRTPTRCCRPTTTACARGTTSTSSSPASSRSSTGCRCEDAALHCARGAGIWEWAGNKDDVGHAARRRAGLRRRRADAGDAGRRGDPARASCPTCASASSTSST